MQKRTNITKYMNPRRELIVIVDDDMLFLNSLRRFLEFAGFVNVKIVADPNTALTLVNLSNPDLLMVDIHFDECSIDGLQLLRTARKQGYAGKAVVISGDRSPEQFFKAARIGACDFLVKGPHLDVAKEIDAILRGDRGNHTQWTRQEAIMNLGFLRSFGLSDREVEILAEFSVDFPRMRELAERIDKSEVQLRKIFSRIYAKLEVENLSQLTHVLSVCEMFDQEN